MLFVDLCMYPDPNFSWMVSLREFAHPAIDKFSAVGTIGPTFFLAIAMFGFVFQITSLITEKELKLRQVLACCFMISKGKHVKLILCSSCHILTGNDYDGSL